jgi:hypothetical protein
VFPEALRLGEIEESESEPFMMLSAVALDGDAGGDALFTYDDRILFVRDIRLAYAWRPRDAVVVDEDAVLDEDGDEADVPYCLAEEANAAPEYVVEADDRWEWR